MKGLKDKLRNILTFGLYKKLLKIDNYNINYFNNLDFDKRFHYEKLKDPNKKSLLLIARFNQNGGIEKRQTAMLKCLERYYNIFILSHVDTFNYEPLLLRKNYFVYLTNIIGSPKAILEQYIRKITAFHDIDYTEVHFGPLLTLNYKNLKVGKSKLIAHIHSSLSFYNKRGNKYSSEFAVKYLLANINNFDCIIKVKSNDIDIDHHNIYVIPNGIEKIEDVYVANNSNRCLIISRLDKDKLINIKSIVRFASQNGINIDIAGVSSSSNIVNKDIKQEILKDSKNIEVNFIGSINTIEYLKENYNKYLFVGGVSQVIIEAISLGFPSLLNDDSNYHRLSFINKENFLELYQKNFQVLQELSPSLNEDLQAIKNGDISKFQLGDCRDSMLISHYVEKYKQILDSLK